MSKRIIEFKPNYGFTLLELIMVMTIVGVLAGLFVANYPSSQRKARDTQRISDLRQYQTALEVYANANSGNYPTSGNMSTVCNSELSDYTSVCPDDPRLSTNPPYEYVSSVADYYLYAKLEQPDDSGNDQWYYFCSNGKSDTVTTEPTSNPC